MANDRVPILVSVLVEHPDGLGPVELFSALRQHWPHLTEAQARSVVEAAGELVEVGPERIRLRAVSRPTPGEAGASEAGGVRENIRIVAFDCETAVRLTSTAPYTEAKIFQLAGVRLGTDAAWVTERQTFACFVELPEGFEVFDPEVRALHADQRRPPHEALGAFSDFVCGADYLVAYNGEVADFVFIDQAAADCGMERVEGPERVDAFYLALCLHPHMSQRHGLYHLAADLGIDTEGLDWHDAGADSTVLGRLLWHLAGELDGLGADLRAILGSLCAASPAWQVLFALAGARELGARALEPEDVTTAVAARLSGRPAVRTSSRAVVGAVPDRVKTASGVDPRLVAQAARGSADARPAQDEMARVLRRWIKEGTDGMCEAPTGIGKTYVTLSTAIEWLEAHPSGRVVIATHTKALQRQLASEIDRLAHGDLQWLRAASGMVKGARNRLSLQALVRAVADCSAEVARPGAGSQTLFGERRLCELVAFLVLRIWIPPSELLDEWEARSVDPMDVPAFFDSYCQGALVRWLALLSQAESGDYKPGPSGSPRGAGGAPGAGPGPRAGPVPGESPWNGVEKMVDEEPSGPGSGEQPADPLAAHTDSVEEAVGRHRLVVTNHALLLSHRESIGDQGTLLIVDEAHTLESTVTDALTMSVDYLTFELIAQEAMRCAREVGGSLDVRGLLSVADDLGVALRSEILPNSIAGIFDSVLGPAARRSGHRAATLASAWGGDQARGSVLRAMGEIRRMRRPIDHLSRVIGAIVNSAGYANAGTVAERERLEALWTRASGAQEACAAICDVADAVLGPGPAPARPAGAGDPGGATQPGRGGAGGGGGTAPRAGTGGSGADGSGTDDADDVTPVDDDLADGEVAPEGVDADELTAGGAVAPPAVVNRIVWANELDSPDLIRGMRHYRFAVHASPVELSAEPEWTGLRATFARSIFISATLTVAPRPPERSGFEFVRERLGLRTDVAEHRLPGSFNYANNARLFVMSDFPSWAEHEAQATRSVAWQVSGFLAEVAREGSVPDAPGAPRPIDGGAMVITTSTASASAIADRLDADLAQRGARVPVRAAVLSGNQRALAEFKERGGVLVGTKGLWAGVDVENPERLRMLWINKLPFAPFADPLIQARIAAVSARAHDADEDDPDAVAQRDYYLPLAALELRQGIGRLIRSEAHKGVIVISDRRLAGADRLRRMYREIFLGSLDPGLLVADTAEPSGGNVVTMAQAWEGIFDFMVRCGNLSAERAEELCTPEALKAHSVTPELRRIHQLRLSEEEVAELALLGEDELVKEVRRRCVEVARLLSGNEKLELRGEQLEAISAVAIGRDVLALLPTGFGKSYCYQLPALVLPGVSVVISPLVALMADQAMALNRTIGGAVRAIVAPLRDSSSRAGKAEVAAALRGEDNGIKLVYVSPERAAQRAFREALYDGASSGALRLLAVDEAHTLVQWSDDFRPSFRRLQPVLAELRARAQQAERTFSIGAYTATANPTVRQGLLSAVFGQSGGGGESAVGAIGEPGALGEANAEAARGGPGAAQPVLVSASPIRPELAIYSRQMARGGPVAISGLAEAVAEACHEHLIVYCLTVNEVQSTYAQLRAWIGPEREWQVRRFHGRLSGAEKSAVLDAFKHAPRTPTDPGYYRMIVVATSAFGLGVDRPDVEAVLCLSPPPDLASLYQQLGRAGRGLAQGAGDEDQSAVGMAVAHRSGWRMVEFLTTTDLAVEVLCDLGRRVLSCGGLLDPKAVADEALADAVAEGAMDPDVARLTRTREDYRAGVVRAMATLGALGALVDHGDVPAFVKVTEGPYVPEEKEDAKFVAEALDAVKILALPGARGAERVTCRLADLHAELAVRGATSAGDGPADTWVHLYDAHGAGWLDVSQYASDQRFLSAVEIASGELPEGFATAISGRRVRALKEIGRLREWFAEQTCAQRGFAEYFAEPLAAGVCSHARCRCSRCWFDPAMAVDPDPEPVLFDAFMRHRPAPVAPAEDTRRTARLERQIQDVLRLKFHGVSRSHLEALFNGSDTTWNARMGRGFRVPGWICDHAYFGSGRGWLRRAKLSAVLDALQARGAVVVDGRRYRLARYVTGPGGAAPTGRTGQVSRGAS